MKLLLSPVPHDEAAKFIAGKPAMGRSVFDRLLPELKARAFTISGIASADALQRARDVIAALPQGADWDTQKAKLIGEISPFLVDEAADPETRQKQVELASRRAEVLMRLHGFQSYAAAQHQVMERHRDAFPFWMYQTFGDGRVRPSHAALNGIILPADHPFWKDHTPPWDWGCRCNKVPVTADEAGEYSAAKPGAAAGWVPAPAIVKRMEQTGMLDTGDGRPVDVRSPKEKADDPATAFGWDPGDLRLPVEDLAKRYDAATWAAFRSWAEAQTIEAGSGDRLSAPGPFSVWDWLTRKPAGKSQAWAPVRSAEQFSKATGLRAIVEPEAARQAPAVLNAVGAERERMMRTFPGFAEIEKLHLVREIEVNRTYLDAAGSWGEHNIVNGRVRLHPKTAGKTFAKRQSAADASRAGREHTAYDSANSYRHECGHGAERLLTSEERRALNEEFSARNAATVYREVSGYANVKESEAFAELFNLIARGSGDSVTSFPRTRQSIRRILGA